MDKLEYLTVEDEGYIPGVAEKVKFEYCLLGEVFNKVFKKDCKVNKARKYENDFMYDSVHNFIKYSVFHFNKISSFDSKFDTVNQF